MEDPSLAAWDWDSLLDFNLDGNDPQILPWDSPPPPPPPPPPAAAENPPMSPATAVTGRVRKRDPRLVCENFLAGRVPCACPEEDEMMRAEEAAKAEAGVRKRPKSATGLTEIRCQVAGCGADIRELKGYHRRHRVCLRCANAPSVPIDGADRRYCQQCGKFHLLTDFDEGKRSCRRKLERHNRRRRRKPTDCINVAEDGKEPQRDLSTDFTCDGELRSENEFACEALETILNNKVIDREMLLDSDNGQGSPICSRPSSQNEQSNNIVSFPVSGEAYMDEAKDNPKSAISSTVCDDRNTYSSLCPTGRISFKLYDWNPAEFPRRLRHQIFHWLASMPVELEGYIRPGCTILTIFIAMPQFMWEKLYQDASLYIRDLVNAPESLFLGRGNIFIYLSNMIVHLLEDGSSLMNIKMEVKAPRIHYVHPTYFEAGKPMEFVACGSNLDQPKFRLLISISGKYLVYDSCHAIFHGKLMPCGEGHGDSFHDSDHEMFRICINQTDPELFGPAFIEVENESGISNFIPLLFGNKHICSELERMQGAPTGSLCIDNLLSQVAVSGASPVFCEILVSRQAALSELITDIAWFLKERDTDKSKAVMSSTNIQRLTCLLKFSIQNEFVNVLEVILQYFDAVIRVGIHKLENVIPHADQKLLLEYINCAKEIIKQKGLLDVKSEQDSGSSIQRILGPQSYDIGAKNKDEEVRNIDETCSTSPSPFQDDNENIPLLRKPMIERKNYSQHLHDKWHRESWFDMYSPTFYRTRLSVFVMVGVVMCFVACVVFVHPLDDGGLVVSIRRCLFGDPLP